MTHRRLLLIAAASLALAPGLAGAAGTVGDAEILRQYRGRCAALLRDAAAVDPNDLGKGTPVTVAACFHLRAHLEWANARLARIDAPMPTGDMFWMYPIVTAMEAGRDTMTAANRARLRELWRTTFPYRGDTENHWLLYYASLCLAAEANPGAGPGAWYNGKSSAENIAEARAYIGDWIRITTSYGQGEFNSPNYIEEYAAPLALLAGWEADAALRERARMMLDYLFFDYAVEQLNGEYGGAHSRVYPWQIVQPGKTPAAAFGWLLFGLGPRQPRDTALIVALSGYAPPPILYRIAHDRTVPYVDRQLKRTRWRMRSAGPDAFQIGGKSTVPVYKYTYMDRDFVLGSCQGGPLQSMQQQTWGLIWATDRPLTAENTFFGLQPYASPLVGTMYYTGRWDTVVHAISTGSSGKLDYDTPDKLEGGSPFEQVFQHGPALIALYDIPPGTRFPLVDTFFSRDLDRCDTDPSGWIFCRGGPAFFGYRPLAPGAWKAMGWTGLMGRLSGGWFASGYDGYARGNRCLVSASPRNGYVVQAAPARDYASFEAFEDAVRRLPVRSSLEPRPDVVFTTLDGAVLHARMGEAATVGGRPVDHAHWPLFDSPYGHSERGSGRLEMTHGEERYVLDFNTPRVESPRR
jgi:hypothetical protein